mgnify:CR=1 FL=1
MFTAFLIKYAEIGVKGTNRYLFEDALVQQIKYALKKCEGEFKIHKTQGRIFVDALTEFDFDETKQALTVTDLLADVIIYPNGIHHVVDLDEMADAQEQSLISSTQLNRSLRQLDKLLNIIQKGEFPKLLAQMESLGL